MRFWLPWLLMCLYGILYQGPFLWGGGGMGISHCMRPVIWAMVKVPLRRKFVRLFRPNSVAEYRVVSIFTQKTEQETVHPNIF